MNRIRCFSLIVININFINRLRQRRLLGILGNLCIFSCKSNCNMFVMLCPFFTTSSLYEMLCSKKIYQKQRQRQWQQRQQRQQQQQQRCLDVRSHWRVRLVPWCEGSHWEGWPRHRSDGRVLAAVVLLSRPERHGKHSDHFYHTQTFQHFMK